MYHLENIQNIEKHLRTYPLNREKLTMLEILHLIWNTTAGAGAKLLSQLFNETFHVDINSIELNSTFEHIPVIFAKIKNLKP